MTRTVVTAVALGLVVLTAMPSITLADRVDQRQINQERRIQQGVRSGSLTRGEYVRLEQEQARIRDLERRAKADGRVDRYERWQLERAQDRASRHIFNEKHDGQSRWSGWHRRWW